MRIELFVWNEQNRAHIARHGVHTDEIDEVISEKYRVVRSHSDRYLLLGCSAAGRYLAVIFEVLENGHAKVITARDMTDAERRRFLKLL